MGSPSTWFLDVLSVYFNLIPLSTWLLVTLFLYVPPLVVLGKGYLARRRHAVWGLARRGPATRHPRAPGSADGLVLVQRRAPLWIRAAALVGLLVWPVHAYAVLGGLVTAPWLLAGFWPLSWPAIGVAGLTSLTPISALLERKGDAVEVARRYGWSYLGLAGLGAILQGVAFACLGVPRSDNAWRSIPSLAALLAIQGLLLLQAASTLARYERVRARDEHDAAQRFAFR